MEYSKQYMAELAAKTNFIKDTLEKVLRLSEILKFLNEDEVFEGNFALKGGTAINLMFENLPRLSVDIDLDFAINVPKEEVENKKEIFSKRLIGYMAQEGYSLNANTREHFALLSFNFSYTNNSGNRDNIKVEINFLDRCHILPLEKRSILTNAVIEPFEVLVVAKEELYASKINALLSRATPRDLYDTYCMINHDQINDEALLLDCLIFYNMVGGDQDIDRLDYKKIQKINFAKYRSQLKPVLSKKDKFDIEVAKEVVIDYLKRLIVISGEQQEFIGNFRKKQYLPELLFSDNLLENIKLHPMAIWRCREE